MSEGWWFDPQAGNWRPPHERPPATPDTLEGALARAHAALGHLGTIAGLLERDLEETWPGT